MTVLIEVLICTFRRPHLAQTLASLAAQLLPPDLGIAVIVADNDDRPSAQGLVAGLAPGLPYPITYLHAPARNISLARNACLDHATAPWVAFVDDDETADPGWIAGLWQAAQDSGADAVFGPAHAVYPPGTPDWIVARDYHSNLPERRGGQVMTGHTCNALLRWQGARWQTLRFDLARGTAGGEDTAFFFAARRSGARLAATTLARVSEPVAPARLRFGWLVRRKFRMGQSYAASEPDRLGQLRLAVTALGKAAICAAAAVAMLPVTERRNFWALRGILHVGVIAGCLALPQPQSYGR